MSHSILRGGGRRGINSQTNQETDDSLSSLIKKMSKGAKGRSWEGPREGEAGQLDMRFVSGQSARKLWLVRVPHEVADALDNAAPGQVLGELTMEKGKAGAKRVSMDPATYAPGSMAPADFELCGAAIDTDGPSSVAASSSSSGSGAGADEIMYGVSVTKDRRRIRAEGTVSKSYILRPSLDSNQYMEYTRKRNQKAGEEAASKRARSLNETEEETLQLVQAQKGSIFEAKAIFAAMDEARDKSAAAAAATASAAPRVSRPKEYAEGELREALFTALHDVESGKMTYKDLKARLNPAREEDLRRLLDERSNLCMKEKNGNKVYYKIHPDIAGNR